MTLTWSHVAELRSRTRLPLILKGILDPVDALRAVELEVDAVVVSNHGGRQLDGALPSVDAPAEVAGAVGDRCEVLLDSWVRGGTDVLKALALGAPSLPPFLPSSLPPFLPSSLQHVAADDAAAVRDR
ncbi:alpha-hydroxy-acid oxidizing protein [Streptomyces sp. NPDC050610]|uniref:alpha-hydroxy-acid oxidizing protein n=1 Tax=Streptomyces sp. NPDC050610 TaxID=3157097 RepID=UPI00342ABA97